MDNMTYIWNGDTVYNETVLPLRKGGEIVMPLLYDAEKIISVKSYDLKREYEQGRDWLLREGKFVVPENTTMEIMPFGVYNFTDEPEGIKFPSKEGGYLLFTEGTYIVDRQYCITYTHSPSSEFLPGKSFESLPKTKQKLKNGQPITIAFFGDSITVGCNASKLLGIEPFMPTWPELVSAEIEKKYGSRVTSLNRARGGIGTAWGLENAEAMYSGEKLDLVVLGFGMNDGAVMPADEYISNTQKTADIFRKICPGVEILFVAASMPNPLADEAPYHLVREPLLLEMAKRYGESATVLPLTTLFNKILRRKPYSDMTANNINHPNDFLARIYGQTVFYSIEP